MAGSTRLGPAGDGRRASPRAPETRRTRQTERREGWRGRRGSGPLATAEGRRCAPPRRGGPGRPNGVRDGGGGEARAPGRPPEGGGGRPPAPAGPADRETRG